VLVHAVPSFFKSEYEVIGHLESDETMDPWTVVNVAAVDEIERGPIVKVFPATILIVTTLSQMVEAVIVTVT